MTAAEQSGVNPPPADGAAGSAKAAKSRLPSGFATLRDVVSFVVGMVIIGNEVFVSSTVEAAAVAVGTALTGLPLVFGSKTGSST